MLKTTRSGFSLVELMIYIAIVGMLMAVLVPSFMGYLQSSRKSATESNLRALESAILLFNVHTGQYPARISELVKKPADEQVARKW